MNKKLILGMAVAAVALTACDDEKKSDDSVALDNDIKAAVEQYVPSVIYKTYNDLAMESEALYNLLAAAAEEGVDEISQDDIDAICAQFLLARQSWEESEAFLYGAATDFGIDPHIDTWPLDVEALATALSNSAQVQALEGEDGIAYASAKLGAELLGFHGIEFILFRDGQNRTVEALRGNEDDEAFSGITVTGEQELIYATAVAGDLRDNCYRLIVSWNPDAPESYKERCEELEVPVSMTGSDKTYGENLLGAAKAGSTYATWQETLASILVAGCSNICNEVANVKMGNAHSGEDVNYIESPYSKKSFQDFIDNILSIQYSLYGKANVNAPVSNSIINVLKNHNYDGVETLQEKLNASVSALKVCQQKGAFVDIYTDKSVQDAMDVINELDEELNKAAEWIVKQ
jgi:hypothetical protein